MKLTTKILLVALFPVMTIMGGFSFVFIENIKENMMQSLEYQLQANAKIVGQRINEIAHKNLNVVKTLARAREIPRALDKYDSRGVSQILNDQVEIYSFIDYILVLENDFTVFTASTRSTNRKKIQSERLLLKNASENSRFPEGVGESVSSIGSIGRDEFLSEMGVEPHLSQFYVAPISKRGRIVGWVLMAVNWGLVHQRIIDETVGDLLASNVPISGVYLYGEFGKSLVNAVAHTDFDQGESIVSSDRFSVAENRGAIEVHYDRRAAVASINSVIQYALIGLLVCAGVLSSILYFALNKIVLARFSVLTRMMEEIGQDGNVKRRINLSGRDELAFLGKSINKMVDGMFEKTTSIDQLNEAVEFQNELIREKDKKEQELLETRKYIDGITDSAPQLLSYVDAGQRYQFVNMSYERWFGVPQGSFIGAHIKEGLGDAAYEKISPYINKALSGESVTYSSVVPYSGGGERYIQATYIPDINDKSEVLGFFVSVEDITALKQAENSLRLVLKELDAQKFAFDQHAIVAITDVKGTITYVNDLFCDVSGYRREELMSQNHRMLNSGYHNRSFFTELYKVISSGRVWHGEICNRTKNGEEYWVDTTIVPFMNENGKPKSYIAIRTVITEIKKAEKMQENARQAAEESARVKSEFLASMSHEIRTPMNGVLGMLGVLEKSDLSESQLRQLRLAQSSAKSLLVIINDILDFSKIEAGKLDFDILDFDIREMIDAFSESVSLKAAEKNIELVVNNIALADPYVKGDPGRIRQILVNLVGNAIKFTTHGEIIITSSMEKEETGKVRFDCCVKDSGIGIAKNKLDYLFDSFTQADSSTTRKYGGTGLGLSISRQLCQLMGGDIQVESELGMGSEFSFYIYLAPSDKCRQVLPDMRVKNKRVLIVDSNPAGRAVLNGQLSSWGMSVIEASSGSDALKILNGSSENSEGKSIIDLAIIEYSLAEVDGAELGKKIRQNKQWDNIKLVLMTSMAKLGDAKRFSEIGFQAYFPKPVITEDLLRAISVMSEDGAALKNAEPLLTKHYVSELAESDDLKKHNPLNIRVLLAEDNPVNQEVASYLLEDFGCVFDVVNNGQEAIDMLQTVGREKPYDLILMDCQMPEMDGYEATKVIRSGRAGVAHQNIIIVAMTANAMAGDKELCLNVGMNDYVSKPVDDKRLYQVLSAWANKKSANPRVSMVEKIEEPREGFVAGKDLQVWDYSGALRRCGKRNDRLVKLVKSFLLSVPKDLELLENGIGALALEDVKLSAHGLKGVVANLGGDRFAGVLKEVEWSVSKGVADDSFAGLIPALRDEFSRLRSELEAFVLEYES